MKSSHFWASFVLCLHRLLSTIVSVSRRRFQVSLCFGFFRLAEVPIFILFWLLQCSPCFSSSSSSLVRSLAFLVISCSISFRFYWTNSIENINLFVVHCMWWYWCRLDSLLHYCNVVVCGVAGGCEIKIQFCNSLARRELFGMCFYAYIWTTWMDDVIEGEFQNYFYFFLHWIVLSIDQINSNKMFFSTSSSSISRWTRSIASFSSLLVFGVDAMKFSSLSSLK